MGFMFSVFPIIFGLMFCLVLSVFFVVFFKGIKEWNQNNHSPRLSVPATVVGKRANVSHHHHHEHHHHSTSTTYYVTFEVQSGDRMELRVPHYEFGLLVEGDVGTLSFQGTRYLGFARNTAS